MKSYSVVKTFTNKYPFIGPGMWILSLQYFIAQIIVARSWLQPYSIFKNTISDLGNTSCSVYSGRFDCSPMHGLMNASFITLGVFMASGSLLIYQEFKETKAALVGFSFLLIAGIGTAIVGIFPENTIAALHIFGASLPFLIGNLGITILGFTLNMPSPLKIFTKFAGIISLIALFFFAFHIYLGIGIGGMERITAYPQTIWLIVFGVYLSRNHYMKIRAHNK